MNTYASIYIPCMSVDWTEDKIKMIMRESGFGRVARVDFTPVHKKPGFAEDYTHSIMSAFIHFADQVNFATGVPHEVFWSIIERGHSYIFHVNRHEYWICLKNKNPVKHTRMNMHQVVENGRHLEHLFMTQAEEIKNLKETVEKLSKRLEGIDEVVYQLVGGLYCQKTQSGIIDIHLHHLGFEQFKNATTKYDTHPSGIWPTTRQGDENRERIEKLENALKSALDFNTNCFAYEQVDTKSDCSSIPSNVSEERIKNSYDLCGNA